MHWIRSLFGRQRPAVAPLTKTKDGGLKRGEILVAADFLPLFDQQSGGLRLKTLIGIMVQAGWTVTFGSLRDRRNQPGVLANEKGRRRYEDALREEGVTRFLYGPREIDAFLAGLEQDLNWAFLSFPAVAAELIPIIRHRCPLTRIAFDMVDFHAVRLAREAALRGEVALSRAAEQQRAIEIDCAASADLTFAVSVDEKATLQKLLPEAVIEVLPNLFEIPIRSVPGPQGREGLLFVGGFWHTPNGDAMCWFVERIWPIIRRACPSVGLRIAGSNPGPDVLALAGQPGVDVLGYVPDLTPLFDKHRAMVAPLRYGAGMKGKVGQSMAYGLPVVATAIGAEGMGLTDEVHMLIADDEQAFAEKVIRLVGDDALWSRLSTCALSHIERTFSAQIIGKHLATILNR
jgi:O-antigen biosynthesis protein